VKRGLLLLVAAAVAVSPALGARAPSARERTAILAALPADHVYHQRCVRYVVRVSTVDPHYAAVGFRFATPAPPCSPFDGELLFRRSPTRWRKLLAGSDWTCGRDAPAPVLRDLFGGCHR
jgi:hypothetical protein